MNFNEMLRCIDEHHATNHDPERFGECEKKVETTIKHYVCLHEWVEDNNVSYCGVIAVKHSLLDAKEAIRPTIREEMDRAVEKEYIIFNNSDTVFDAGEEGRYIENHCKVWIEEIAE